MTATTTARFQLGQALATPGALEALAAAKTNPQYLLIQHARGQWGDLSIEDARANEAAIESGDRILSAYPLATGARVWVVTEAIGDDGRRAATTILLPEEY
jgi:hypothetical protein